MRIRKFRLAEGLALIFLAVGILIGTASDISRARSGDIPPLEMSPAAGVLAAIVMVAVAVWLLRDAIQRVR